MKTTFNRVCAIVVITFLASMAGLNIVKSVYAQAYNVTAVVPIGPIRVRSNTSGVTILIGAGTSTAFTGVTNNRIYVTQASCIGQSSTALTLTLYDDGAALNSISSGTRKMYAIPCTTSITTGAQAQPVTFNPPLETSLGNAVDIGVGTAANSTYVSLNAFVGVR
jgi:hypothetical protein